MFVLRFPNTELLSASDNLHMGVIIQFAFLVDFELHNACWFKLLHNDIFI